MLLPICATLGGQYRPHQFFTYLNCRTKCETEESTYIALLHLFANLKIQQSSNDQVKKEKNPESQANDKEILMKRDFGRQRKTDSKVTDVT
jgi:hypothetical protein